MKISIEKLRIMQIFIDGKYVQKRISELEAGAPLKKIQVVRDPKKDIFYVLDGTHETFAAIYVGKTTLPALEGYEKDPEKASLNERIIDLYLNGNKHNLSPEDFSRSPHELNIH